MQFSFKRLKNSKSYPNEDSIGRWRNKVKTLSHLQPSPCGADGAKKTNTPNRRISRRRSAIQWRIFPRLSAVPTPIRCPTMANPATNKLTQKALAGLRRINLEGLRWRVFDAKGQILGRLASQISTVIQGKDKPTYAPNRDDGDMCIVLNAKDISVTGRKLTDKFYRWHTGYVGNLKERSLKDQMAKDPAEVIRKAVMRMLPRNKLRDDRDRKLRIFAGSEHPFGDRPLETYEMPPRQVREMRPRARRAMIRAQNKAEQPQHRITYISKGKRKEEMMKSEESSA